MQFISYPPVKINITSGCVSLVFSCDLHLSMVSTTLIDYAVVMYLPPDIRDRYKLMRTDLEKNTPWWVV